MEELNPYSTNLGTLYKSSSTQAVWTGDNIRYSAGSTRYYYHYVLFISSDGQVLPMSERDGSYTFNVVAFGSL